jgi:regulator of cell morphogenesis and NO signaling
MRIVPETPVGALVAQRLGRGRLFDRLGIDYCCHGKKSLEDACAERSLDLGEVLSQLAESDLHSAEGDADRVDYLAMPAGALADAIVSTHHNYLWSELPRLSELIDKMAAAHRRAHPELEDVRATFSGLRKELEMHMVKEERVLFPLIKQLEQAQAAFPIQGGSVNNPILLMEHEHEHAGSALQRLQALTGNYQPFVDGCPSYQALCDGLARLENDLHRHIHKENNILFPQAVALEAALGRTAG